MKRKIILLTIMICVLMAAGLLVNRYYAEMNLDSWIGEYKYVDFFPTSPGDPTYPVNIVIVYDIVVYKDNGIISAEIINKGFQTNQHFYANVVGNKDKIDFICKEYEEDSFPHCEEGDLMMSLSIEDGQLITTWGRIRADRSYANDEIKGTYYSKVG